MRKRPDSVDEVYTEEPPRHHPAPSCWDKIPEGNAWQEEREGDLVAHNCDLRVCLAEVGRAPELIARLCLIKKRRQDLFRLTFQMLWSFAFGPGWRSTSWQGVRGRGSYSFVEVRRQKREEEMGVPVSPGMPYSSDLASFDQAPPPLNSHYPCKASPAVAAHLRQSFDQSAYGLFFFFFQSVIYSTESVQAWGMGFPSTQHSQVLAKACVPSVHVGTDGTLYRPHFSKAAVVWLGVTNVPWFKSADSHWPQDKIWLLLFEKPVCRVTFYIFLVGKI